jgi:hypothetical protein
MSPKVFGFCVGWGRCVLIFYNLNFTSCQFVKIYHLIVDYILLHLLAVIGKVYLKWQMPIAAYIGGLII